MPEATCDLRAEAAHDLIKSLSDLQSLDRPQRIDLLEQIAEQASRGALLLAEAHVAATRLWLVGQRLDASPPRERGRRS